MTSLPFVFEAPALFDAYPDLFNTGVGIEHFNENSAIAYYDYKTNCIIFNDTYLAIANDSDVRSKLIHELQHAVQYIEGFSKGGHVSSDTITYANNIRNIVDSKDENTRQMFIDAIKALRKKDKDTFADIFDSLDKHNQNDLKEAMNHLLEYDRLYVNMNVSQVKLKPETPRHALICPCGRELPTPLTKLKIPQEILRESFSQKIIASLLLIFSNNSIS